ncbi:MAG: hypothetical protein WAK20_14220 [Candidatus Acidiferrum sp.]
MIHTITGPVKDPFGVSLQLAMGTCRIKTAVIRQQMGHASAAMTAFYTGEIPLEQIRTEFSTKFGSKIDVLETMETDATA